MDDPTPEAVTAAVFAAMPRLLAAGVVLPRWLLATFRRSDRPPHDYLEDIGAAGRQYLLQWANEWAETGSGRLPPEVKAPEPALEPDGEDDDDDPCICRIA